MFRSVLAFMLIFLFSCGETSDYKMACPRPAASQMMTPVERHGFLSVKGSNLVNKNGDPVQLKGMSSHGLQWFGQFANVNSMRELRDTWGQTVFRAAMYTDEGGYLSNPAIKNKVYEIVNAAKELGVYVIIDWHILKDRNPMWNKDKAKAFFSEMSKSYAACPNVIYEIANEPNGGDVKWWNAIKPYAMEVIPEIRKNAPSAVVIIGTGSWSQEVHDASNDPLKFDNIMYAVHFYAASHGGWLRNRTQYAIDKGISIFVTEFGTMDSSGNGGINYGETDQWMKFLESNKISWANWSLSNSGQSHSILKGWANPNGKWSDRDLSDNGKLIKKYMLSPSYLVFEEGIHIFGDSVFTTINHRIKNLLESDLKEPINDHSRQGAWTKDIKNQYAYARGAKKIAIMNGGGNDVFGNSWDCKVFNDKCKAIVSQAIKNNLDMLQMMNQDNVKKIIILGMHYPSDKAYRASVDYAYPYLNKICQESKAPCVVVDPRDIFSKTKNLLEWDGVHPNSNGTHILADMIFEATKN